MTTGELMVKAARELDAVIDRVLLQGRDFVKSKGATVEELAEFDEIEGQNYATWREETLRKIRGFLDRGEIAH